MAGKGIYASLGVKPGNAKALSAAVTERAWKDAAPAHASLVAFARSKAGSMNAGEGAPMAAKLTSAVGQGDLFGGFKSKPAAASPTVPARSATRAEYTPKNWRDQAPTASVTFKGDKYTVERRDGGQGKTVYSKNGRFVMPENVARDVPSSIQRRAPALLAAGERRADSMPAMGRKPTGPVRMSYSKDAAGEHATVNFRGAKYGMHRGPEETTFSKNGKAIDKLPATLDKGMMKRFDAVKSKAVGRMTQRAADAELQKVVGSKHEPPASMKYMASKHGVKAIEHVRDARISRAHALHQDALAARLKLNGDTHGASKATEAAHEQRALEKRFLEKARAARAEASPIRQNLAKANAGLSAGAKARFAENSAAESKFGASKPARPALNPMPRAQSLPPIPKAYVAPRMNPSTAKTKIAGPGTVEEAHRGMLGGPDVRVTGATLASSNGFHLQGDRTGYRVTDGKSGTVVRHLSVATKAEAINAFKGMASGKTLARAAAIANGGKYEPRSNKALQRFSRIVEKRSSDAAAARKAAPKPSKSTGASATAA